MEFERSEYRKGALGEGTLRDDPLELLAEWLVEARLHGIVEPSAMSLATVGEDGRPSCRIVLLRDLDQDGLIFYTNYESHKGRDFEFCPFAAVTFWWGTLERQVRLEGSVAKVPPTESDAYFVTRPLESRYASSVSPQSRPIPSRDALVAEMDELRRRFPEGPPRPDHWGGYRLRPERIEFWQGRPARLHDRILFVRTEEGWATSRLAP